MRIMFPLWRKHCVFRLSVFFFGVYGRRTKTNTRKKRGELLFRSSPVSRVNARKDSQKRRLTVFPVGNNTLCVIRVVTTQWFANGLKSTVSVLSRRDFIDCLVEIAGLERGARVFGRRVFKSKKQISVVSTKTVFFLLLLLFSRTCFTRVQYTRTSIHIYYRCTHIFYRVRCFGFCCASRRCFQ